MNDMQDIIKGNFAVNCCFFDAAFRTCSILVGRQYSRLGGCIGCPFFKTVREYAEDAARAEEVCRMKGIKLPYSGDERRCKG